MRHFIAHCFGRHSRRVWRCIIGASWTLPLRYFTFGAQLAALSMVPGVILQVPLQSVLWAMTAGVAVGWLASLADRLANEFAIFPAVARFFIRKTPHDL